MLVVVSRDFLHVETQLKGRCENEIKIGLITVTSHSLVSKRVGTSHSFICK